MRVKKLCEEVVVLQVLITTDSPHELGENHEMSKEPSRYVFAFARGVPAVT